MSSEPLPWVQLLILLLSGLAAGFINVVAGGGSLLTLPALLFVGTPATVANATNRISLVFQNIVATSTFHRAGRLSVRHVLPLFAIALPGALLGAWLALELDERSFRRILAAVMLIVLVLILRGSKRKKLEGVDGVPHPIGLGVSFFFMGIYAGFLQAGLGFLLIAALSNLGGFDLIRSNAIKVSVVLLLQVASLILFQVTGNVDWPSGLSLAGGSMLGAWLGARWQMAKGVVWVRRFLIAAVLVFAVRLLQESF